MKLKIKPIEISAGSDIKSISKSIANVVAFNLSLVAELNEFINQFNNRGEFSNSPPLKKEIDSNRKEAGLKIDIVEQKINKLLKLQDLVDELQQSMPIKYDDSLVFNAIEELKKSIPEPYNDGELLAAVNKGYDDSEIKLQIKQLSDKVPASYDDSDLRNIIKELSQKVESLSIELTKERQVSVSLKKEINSNRKESGNKIDTVEQRLNKIKRIK